MGKTLLRRLRILIATSFYLLASFFLLISLRIFPADIREEAKSSFI